MKTLQWLASALILLCLILTGCSDNDSLSQMATANDIESLTQRATEWNEVLASLPSSSEANDIALISSYLEPTVATPTRASEIYASWANSNAAVLTGASIADVILTDDRRHGTVRYVATYATQQGQTSNTSQETEWIKVDGTWYRTIESSSVSISSPEPTTSTLPTSTEAPEVGYGRNNPASIGTTLSTQFDLLGEVYTAELTVLEVIRGQEAWDRISEANMFNDPPSSGREYALAKIRFHYVSSSPSADKEFDWYYFEVVTSKGEKLDRLSTVPPLPNLNAVFPGATTEGWEALEVEEDDPAPLLTFGTDRGSPTSRVWFRLYR